MKRKSLFYHLFRHKRYEIVEIDKRVKSRSGLCDSPKTKDKFIEIPIGHSQASLEIQLHEALHACLFDLDEPTIEEVSTNISKFLWKLGWRNVSVLKSERMK